MYNVFVDFHHASLLQSFILLFEKRLGGKVYRPIGMEWAERGFWKVYDHPATQAQYLSIGSTPIDGTQPLNDVVGMSRSLDPIYACRDIDSGVSNKAITYDKFMATHFDFVIATLPQHIEPFRRLCELHPSHPKLIYQIGNAWNIDIAQYAIVDGVMASAKVSNVGGKPFITYHQEFDLDIFKPVPLDVDETIRSITAVREITSFVNCFNIDQMFQYDWELFKQVEQIMPEWRFRALGGQCRDGAAHGAKQLAETMRNASFIWHTKAGGDGYGHVLHNAAACGRPIIYRESQYQGKMGAALLTDMVTAINIDGLSAQGIVNKLLEANQPETYARLCQNMVQRFKEQVNFDQEEQNIRAFLAQLG